MFPQGGWMPRIQQASPFVPTCPLPFSCVLSLFPLFPLPFLPFPLYLRCARWRAKPSEVCLTFFWKSEYSVVQA